MITNTLIHEKIKAEVEKVHPFVWPKNKDGEDITMVPGQSMPPGSKKHSKQNEKYVKWAEYGYSLAEQQIERLEQWKREALSVMPDMQAIGNALNVPLGESIHDKILPGINRLVNLLADVESVSSAEIDRLKALIEKMYNNYDQTCPATIKWQQFKTEHQL